MNFQKQFRYGVGILLLVEGILGILLYIPFPNIGFIAIGIVLTVFGILGLWVASATKETEPPSDAFYGPIICLGGCFLFGIGSMVGTCSGSCDVYFYLGVVVLSWGVAIIYWSVMNHLQKKTNEN